MENYDQIRLPWPDWKILRRLGGGGFGTVYEIERDIFGEKEHEALKVIHFPKEESDLDADYDSGMTDEEVREKYEYFQKHMLEEYRQMIKYKGHSNIVNCHDFSVTQDPCRPGFTIYIRMELLTPLKNILEKGKLSEARIIQVGQDICQALEVCERDNLIHRDIKPDNILMSEFGDFKLGDFGIARTMEKTMSASMSGTDWYMAPEVAKKTKYGKSVDTYSLGLVLYWMLNQQRLPFVPLKDRITAKDMDQAYRLRMQGNAIPEPAGGSPKLKAVVLKSIAYDRDQRYHSAKEMLEALRSIEKAAEGETTVKPEPVKPVQRQRKQDTIAVKGMLGICLDAEEILVRMWIDGATRPILKMQAVYTYNALGDILAGNRAIIYQKCHPEKQLYSVLEGMKAADTYINSASKKSAEEKCVALMKELKNCLARTPYGENRECIITDSLLSPIIQKSVCRAMKEAGFIVKRQLNIAVACAVSKAYQMSQNRNYTVCVAANGERQYVTAEYESDVLEILDSTADLQLHKRTAAEYTAFLNYYFGDRAFFRNHQEEASGYDELLDAAADGAALYAARLNGCQAVGFFLIDCFPWAVGIEIVDKNKNVCFPLTWMLQDSSTVPVKSEPVGIHLDDGIQGKYLRLYIKQSDTTDCCKIIREWSLKEAGRKLGTSLNELEAVLQVNTDMQCISVELTKSGTNQPKAELHFREHEERKDDFIPPETEYVPQSILQNIGMMAEKFCEDAKILENMDINPAVWKGIQMIAKQSSELLGAYRMGATNLRIDSYVEKILTIADNLEYGLKEAERIGCLDGKRVLLIFYRALQDNLLKLNLTPIDAEGLHFDPYVHHAIATEKVPGVAEDMITEEIQKGYLKCGKLLRPASVKVAK